jgi:3-methyladenine DNA glycosylase AlkD
MIECKNMVDWVIVKNDLEKFSDRNKAIFLPRFFKTGPGEYGEGDKFLGIIVPNQRFVAKKYWEINFTDIEKLLHDEYHECRLTALLILIIKYHKSNLDTKQKIYNFYLGNTKYINNWDLVDLSAPSIVGNYLLDQNRDILIKLAKSKSLWERRISIISTFEFIKNNQFSETIQIAEILVDDKHDLIQKAVGWMLRETGKRNQKLEEEFLHNYYRIMPRTMLRYAIEKFSNEKRKYYLAK